jgi:hypothetical protein
MVEKRQELWTDVNRPYLFGQAPAKNTIPLGCTERVRTYLREYIKLAFSVDLAQDRYDGDEDKECLALWLARAQWLLLNRLDELFLHRPFKVPELLYLRKKLITVQAKLSYGASCLIRLRARKAHEPDPEFFPISCRYLSPEKPTQSWSQPSSQPVSQSQSILSFFSRAYSPLAPSTGSASSLSQPALSLSLTGPFLSPAVPTSTNSSTAPLSTLTVLQLAAESVVPRASDCFDLFNCYFTYNPVKERMELLTKGPMGPGLYKVLRERDRHTGMRDADYYCHYEARQRCLAYYGGFLY